MVQATLDFGDCDQATQRGDVAGLARARPIPSARAIGLRDGRRRRDASHFVLTVRREPWVRAVQRKLIEVLMEHGRGTADDVRVAVDLPMELNPALIGAAIRGLAVAGLIERSGYEQTARPVAHARPIAVWTLRDRTAAEAWLASHPDMLVRPESGVTA